MLSKRILTGLDEQTRVEKNSINISITKLKFPATIFLFPVRINFPFVNHSLREFVMEKVAPAFSIRSRAKKDYHLVSSYQLKMFFPISPWSRADKLKLGSDNMFAELLKHARNLSSVVTRDWINLWFKLGKSLSAKTQPQCTWDRETLLKKLWCY